MSTFTERFSGKINKMSKGGISQMMEGTTRGNPADTGANWKHKTHTQGINHRPQAKRPKKSLVLNSQSSFHPRPLLI
jgi:hypothetical protein